MSSTKPRELARLDRVPLPIEAARIGVTGWQLYFWRDSDWSNAQSSGNLVQAAQAAPAAATAGSPPATGGAQAAREELPRAVRLVITLRDGKLTRDIALGATGS